MSESTATSARVMLLDACGERAAVAACAGDAVLASETMAPGAASAQVVGAVERVLAAAGLRLGELDAVGVVSGPGSFTGVRVGLATAKGLCEAAGVPMVAVSRLAVLAELAGASVKVVALPAGRGEVYARADGREWLASEAELQGQSSVAAGEAALAERLGVEWIVLDVAAALPVVLRRLQELRGSDVLCDANYVRGEQNIYAKPLKAAGQGSGA